MATLYFKQFGKDIAWWLDLPEKSIVWGVKLLLDAHFLSQSSCLKVTWKGGWGMESRRRILQNYFNAIRIWIISKRFSKDFTPPKFPKLLSHQWLPHKCCGIKGGGAFKWHRSWIWAYWNEWQIMDLLRVRPWDFWPTGANSPTQGQATLGLGPQGGGSGPGWAYGLCTTLLLEFKFFED